MYHLLKANLLIPSPWALDLQYINLTGCKHSDHSSWEMRDKPGTSIVLRGSSQRSCWCEDDRVRAPLEIECWKPWSYVTIKGRQRLESLDLLWEQSSDSWDLGREKKWISSISTCCLGTYTEIGKILSLSVSSSAWNSLYSQILAFRLEPFKYTLKNTLGTKSFITLFVWANLFHIPNNRLAHELWDITHLWDWSWLENRVRLSPQ